MKEEEILRLIEELKQVTWLKERAWLLMGRYLAKIKREGLWKGYAESFQEFVADPELRLPSYRRCLDIIRAYEVFVEHWGIPEDRLVKIGVDRLRWIAKKTLGGTREELEEWLRKAEVLSKADFIAELTGKEYKPGKCPVCGGDLTRCQHEKEG